MRAMYIIGLGALLAFGCNRPTAEYDVSLVGDGQGLGDLSAPPEPMGGLVEYTRIQILGDNIGLGVTGLYGDQPAVSGTVVVMGTAHFGYPSDPSFDGTSNIMTPATSGAKGADRCVTLPGPRKSPGAVESVDVGDTIRLTGTNFKATLPRDPAIYPRPAGEEWYVAYGTGLLSLQQDQEGVADNWRSGAGLTLSYPGTILPDSATMGAVPFPGDAPVSLPSALADLTIDGEPLSSTTRIQGPWAAPTVLSWTPHSDSKPLVLSLRLLGDGVEGTCDCEADCGSGFDCEEGVCVGQDGATWNQLGEVVCHIEDDGSFELTPAHVGNLLTWSGEGLASGVILGIGRMEQSTFNTSPVLTQNIRRVDTNPIRTRTTDIIFTRVEVAP